jgi:ribosomal protein S18 acetylase RimI-like enzyme
MSSIVVRSMTTSDLDAVGALAGRLVRLHHGFDPQRYLHLENPERGYARYFRSELDSDDAVLLVAEEGPTILGYAYGRMEPRSYNELLDACGKLHDVYVDETARGRGAGEALVREIFKRLREKGAPRVLLLTAVQNEAGRRLFERLGFRTTMLEMTREL